MTARETVSQPGKELDDALEETFPASDPIAGTPKRGGKDDKRVQAPISPDRVDTTDEKTPANMALFHKAFERRRR